MKKSILSWCLILLPSLLIGQVYVDSSHFPSQGDVFINAISITDTVDVLSPSASAQVWDFSNATPDGVDTIPFLDPALTPYSNIFTNATMARYDKLDGTYYYFSKDADGVFVEGINIDATFFGIGRLTVEALSTELLFGAPASLDSSFTSVALYEGEIALNKGDFLDTLFRRRVIKYDTVDAYGTLYTPFDTFDVIRLHEYVITYDSAILIVAGFPTGGFGLGADTSHNYWFISDSLKYPVATVYGDKNGDFEELRFVNGSTPPPTANFEASPLNALSGEDVNFYNLSTGQTSWKWHFGDGNTSQDNEPVHTYAAAGNYEIKLVVSNKHGEDSLSKSAYVNIFEEISASYTYTKNGMEVTFNNQSINATDYSWDFGDASSPSTMENPVHTFPVTGMYTVTLTATNPASNKVYVDSVNVAPVGIAEGEHIDFKVFPNPSEGVINLNIAQLHSENIRLRLINQLGQEIHRVENVMNQSLTLSLENEGQYIIELIDGTTGQVLKAEQILVVH